MTIEGAFWAFHRRNPNVYRQLVTMTREAKSRGRSKVGIGMLFEVLRWNRIIEGLPDETEDFKLNNNYRSRYARMIMAGNPDLTGMFELRELKSASDLDDPPPEPPDPPRQLDMFVK